MLLDAEPCCPSSEAVMLVDDVQEIGGDGVVEPGENNAVHACPCQIVEAGDVTENVILQGEATKDEEQVAMPLGVVGVEIKNDGDEVLDVLDGGGLAVKVNDGSGLGGEGSNVVIVMWLVIMRKLGAKAVPEGCGLLLEEIRLCVLLVERFGGGVDAVLGRGGRLEEVVLHLEGLAMLRIGGAEGGWFVLNLFGGGGGFVVKLSRGGRGGGAGDGGHGDAAAGTARAGLEEAGAAVEAARARGIGVDGP